MAAERELTAEEVQVSTVTVDVQVIRIGRRQMTKAVYEQLPWTMYRGNEESGVIWGWVNVTPAWCKRTAGRMHLRGDCSDHLHFIWSLGGKLYQDYVPEWIGRDGNTRNPLWERIYDHGQLFIAV